MSANCFSFKVHQTVYGSFAPGPQYGTSVSQTPSATAHEMTIRGAASESVTCKLM